jgi:hypothetical protein
MSYHAAAAVMYMMEGNNVLLVVQGIHGRIGISIVGETHEAKAPAATGVAVLHDDLLRRKQFVPLTVTGATRCHSRLLRLGQTPRTFGGECHRPYARQGHCKMLVGDNVWGRRILTR